MMKMQRQQRKEINPPQTRVLLVIYNGSEFSPESSNYSKVDTHALV